VAWFNLGDVQAKAGRKEEAERSYERAFALRDGAGFFYPEAHNRLAALLVERGDRAGAESQYRQVVERAPRQYTALVNLGQLLMSDPARRDESIALLHRAVEAKPDGHVGHANLAQALGMAGRLGDATKAIDAALRLRPLDQQMWRIKASIAAAAGDQAGAAEAQKRVEALRGGAR
jgi:tetratricopeptide (TPR) repeat protein